MEKKPDEITIVLKNETAVWLRSVLDGMEVKGSVKGLRPLLTMQGEIVEQLPGGENDHEGA